MLGDSTDWWYLEGSEGSEDQRATTANEALSEPLLQATRNLG